MILQRMSTCISKLIEHESYLICVLLTQTTMARENVLQTSFQYFEYFEEQDVTSCPARTRDYRPQTNRHEPELIVLEAYVHLKPSPGSKQIYKEKET